MSQYSDEFLDRVRQKDSIIEGPLHQLVRDLAGELLESRRLRRLYGEMLEREAGPAFMCRMPDWAG